MHLRCFFRLNLRKFIFLMVLPIYSFGFTLNIEVYPYLQPGNASKLDHEKKVILWQTNNEDASFEVIYSKHGEKSKTALITHKILPYSSQPRLYRAELPDLSFDSIYNYHVLFHGKPIRKGSFHTRTKGDHFKFVIFGCGGEGTPAQLEVAEQIARQNPSFIVHLGDFTYPLGLASEYLTKGFPYYNKSDDQQTKGTFLMSQYPFYFTFGNHDMGDGQGLSKHLDNLASFYYFEPPCNGPKIEKQIPGESETVKKFLSTVGDRFYSMTVYSFDVGHVHFLMLDGNTWVNPGDPELQKWIKNDLTTSKATWKLAFIHQPPFASLINSLPEIIGDRSVAEDRQRARKYVPLFQENGIDMVISAHIHDFERSKKIIYDAKANNVHTPEKGGIPYIISGAGGAHLHLDMISQFTRGILPQAGLIALFKSTPYLEKGVFNDFSFSAIEVHGKQLEFSQISREGKKIDSLILKKD